MAALSREFPLDPAVLGAGSAVGISVGGTTNPATLAAIATNAPFPSAVDLGRVAIEAATGQGIVFKAGKAAVSFKGSAKLESGIGIFDSPVEAIRSLGLDAIERFDPQLPSPPSARWAAMRWSYDVMGAASGAHPIGAIGAATLSAEAQRGAVFAVLHRFDTVSGARDVLAATVGSWRLPRHVGVEGNELNLRPSTWIVAEADGSLSLRLGATLGYDVSFAHESRLLGLTRDLGATLDTNVKATLGLTVSGRYLVVIGRESQDPASRLVRLRLFKESRSGLRFGLNLNVGVTGTSPLPTTFDEFVQTVFGVHGPQVLKDLGAIEQWADPSADLAQTTARLATRTGIDLLQRATGLNLPAQFHDARKTVIDALNRWDRLPDRLSAMLWRVLAKQGGAIPEGLEKLLQTLATTDLEARRDAIAAALRKAPLDDSAEAEWLQSIAEQGLLALTNDLDRVSALARETLAILEGGVVQRIQHFILEKMDLATLRRAVTDDDFKAVDEWLAQRLADLLNKSALQLDDLRQVQRAVFAVDRKVRSLYEQGMKALSSRHSAEVASVYERSRADTALLDVSFDLSKPASLARFRRVVDDGDLDDLIVTPVDGVTLNQAALSHGIRRQARVEVRLPFVTGETTRVMDSLASLSIDEDAGRLLVYEFDASDRVATANRARSELSILGGLQTTVGGATPTRASGTIGYEERQVRRAASLEDLEDRTRPFIEAYLSPLFPDGGTSLDAFYAAVGAGLRGTAAAPRERSDVALAMQLSYPAHVLAGWLMPRDEAALHHDTMNLSRAIQSSVRRLLPRTYFDDPDHLQAREPVAALLVWASMPLSTSIDTRGPRVRFNTDRDEFWDYPSRAARRAVAGDGHTVAALKARLGSAQARLREAGRSGAGQFDPAGADRFIDMALAEAGDMYLSSLLNAEALMIGGATGALRTIADAVAKSRRAPSAAVRALAEFAGALVETFGGRLQFVYTKEAMRVLGPLMLAEASAAIHPAFQDASPSAVLRMFVLRPGHTFAAEQFLKGELPPADNVATAQTLVRV